MADEDNILISTAVVCRTTMAVARRQRGIMLRSKEGNTSVELICPQLVKGNKVWRIEVEVQFFLYSRASREKKNEKMFVHVCTAASCLRNHTYICGYFLCVATFGKIYIGRLCQFRMLRSILLPSDSQSAENAPSSTFAWAFAPEKLTKCLFSPQNVSDASPRSVGGCLPLLDVPGCENRRRHFVVSMSMRSIWLRSENGLANTPWSTRPGVWIVFDPLEYQISDGNFLYPDALRSGNHLIYILERDQTHIFEVAKYQCPTFSGQQLVRTWW